MEKVDFTNEILSHLEKAVAVDPKDPYALHLLGVQQYNKKDYNAAISSFQKAESIRANFSSSNLYYLGVSLKISGKTDDAIKNLKQAVITMPKCGDDRKASIQAKEQLRILGVKPEEYIVEDL
uniref:TPR_REGION domain-containing protein n=1 Tax=Heterorhabditis bacteriophora TaxID=37862 RepID=A0A1I7XKZ7_HETBA